jgi:hypothetical protein
MIKNFLFCFALLFSLPGFGQQVTLSGKITDSQGTPIGFTSVYIDGTTQVTCANQEGVYELKLNPGKYTIHYRFVGFGQQTDQVEVSANAIHNVQLSYDNYQAPPAPGTTGEDPAFAIIRNAIQKRAYYLNELNAYSCNVYIQGMQKLLVAPKGLVSREVLHELEINLTRNSILYLSEARSQFNYEQPNHVKEIQVSSKATGSNNAFNFSRAQNLQVNFYKNLFDIEGINPRGFVSPIADNALQFYTYKLLGTTTEDGKTIDKIQVIPLRDRGPVFRGNIYIVDGDWRIYSTHLYLTKKQNLNFVDTLNINQQYIPIKGNIWQPAAVSFTYSGNVLGFGYDGYILGIYSSYNLDPQFPPGFFNGETLRIPPVSVKRDSAYWAQNRPVPLTDQQQKNYNLKDQIAKKKESPAYLDSLEKANNHFSPVSYIFFGDTVKHRAKQEVFTLNPLYQTLFYNTVEGWTIDLQGSYTKTIDSNRNYTISPELRYGFENNIVSINSGLSYTFDAANQGAVYGKIGTGIYDINNQGSTSLFFNGLSSLLFKDNELKLYRSKDLMAGVKKEVYRGLLLDGSLQYSIRNALQNTSNRTLFSKPDKQYTSNNPFIPDLNAPLLFQQSNALTLNLSATFAFDETYTTTPSGRVYDQSKYPKLKLTYRKGIKGLGSDVDYDYGEIKLYQDHINLGIYGYSAFLITAGNFFNATSLTYPDYKWFLGNQGITFEPGISEFHFLPFYTYSSTAFVEAHYEHNFGGFIFNNFPGIAKLKLEEIVGGNFLTETHNPNYGELYIGVQRFFLRLDYGFVYRGDGHFDQGVKIYYGL